MKSGKQTTKKRGFSEAFPKADAKEPTTKRHKSTAAVLDKATVKEITKDVEEETKVSLKVGGKKSFPKAVVLPEAEGWKKTSFEGDTVELYSWNVNGIRAVLGKSEIQNFIKKYNPSILCINETKIDEQKLDKEKLKEKFPKEYLQYWNCVKPPKSGYAGTLIFTKVKPLAAYYDLGIDEHDKEGRTITLEFDKFFLVACYVPNAGQKLDRLDYRTKNWDQAFKAFLKELESRGKPVILTGDLNVAHEEIDIANAKGNTKSAGFTKEERAEFTKLLNDGFVDSFRHLYPKEVKYSYWSVKRDARKMNIGWRLDYFVISKGLLKNLKNSEILTDVMGSDHCPVKLTLQY